MFDIFEGIQKSVQNAIDVGIGIMTLGEYGELNKKTISKLISDGISIAVIAKGFDVAEDVIEKILKDE